MRRNGGSRNDLIIGMTLAEIFLLLLIVSWYGSKLESSAISPGDAAAELRRELALTKTELHRTQIELESEKALNRQMDSVLNWLARYVQYRGDVTNQAGWEKAIKSFETAIKRGKPVCGEPNLLIEVLVEDATQAVTLKAPFGRWKATTVLTGATIDEFLGQVDAFSRGQVTPCAYDYSLTWKTDTDFRIGKQRYESYFYPAGDRRVR